MAESKTLPLSTRFQQKITEESNAKKANVEAQKLAAAEDRRRHDLRVISGLELTVDERSSGKTEPDPQHSKYKRDKNRRDLPELDTRHIAPIPLRPAPLPSPPHSSISQVRSSHSEDRCTSPQTESKLVLQLQADLGHQRTHIERLEKDLESTKYEVSQLRTEREKIQQEHLEAIRRNEKEVAVDLKEQVAQLVQLLEDTRKRERSLENEVDEGRSRERLLTRQLDESRREQVALTNEMEALKSARTPVTSDSPPKDNRARRTSSSRGGSKQEKTKFEFSVRKGERHSSAVLLKSAIQSRA